MISSDNTDSECSIDSEHSDVCSVEEYDIEVEEEDGDLQAVSSESNENLVACDLSYTYEPMADEDWLKQYEKEQKENEKLQRMLEKRLGGKVRVDSW